MSNALLEAQQELFIALTARWRQNDGSLAIGVSQSQLLKAIDITKEALENLLSQLKEKIETLGLELVDYHYQGELWYAIRSSYNCPNELTVEEEATLAVIIQFIENMHTPKTAIISIDQIKKKLIDGKYFTNPQLERTIKRLEYLGYIKKNRKGLTYSPRILLEFSQEARKHIAEEAQKLIL